MKLLDVKKKPRGGLLERGRSRVRLPVAPRFLKGASQKFVAYVVVSTDTAAVTAFPDELEEWQSRTDESDEASSANEAELTSFLQFGTECEYSIEEEGSTGEANAFLDTVYDFVKRQKEDHAIDVIFEYINQLLVERRFEACDRILGDVEIARIPTVLMVSFLTITAAAKSKLRNRRRFYKSVERFVALERGNKAAQHLLDGLE